MENVGMDVKRCFKILEIKETESIDEIKQAYRDLIAIWHPDRYTQNPRLQEKATEKVKTLNRAYNYLLSHASQIKTTNQKKEPSEKKKRPDRGVRNKKRDAFRWFLLCLAGCIGLYMVAPHLKMILSSYVPDYALQSNGEEYQLLMRALERHSGIAQLHQDWPVISRSEDFDGWIEEQTITSPELCKQIIATGSVAQVASLVDLYKFDRLNPKPVSMPPSGVIHKSYVKGFAPLTIQARHDGRHYYVKLIRAHDHSEAFSAFIKSGFTLTEYVPIGKYRLKYAVGKTWYGVKWLFGSETVFHSMDQVFDFRFQGNEIKGYRLNLYLTPLKNSQAQKTYAFDF